MKSKILPKNKKYYKLYHGKWYRENSQRLKDLRVALKEKVYSHYGNKCNCCGEDNPKFLTIDHVNNDGYKERKGRGGSSDQIHRNIIKNNYPNTYQLLCCNCNMGKARNRGVCPHKE